MFKEIKEYLKQLAQDTEQVKKSNFFKQYLNTVSKFWKYSYYNQLLIYLQYPNATKVAGMKTWNQLKRKVIKGSRAIKVFAPRVVKTGDEETVTGFFKVNVFDISQTVGEDLPKIEIEIDGENKQLFKKLLNFCKLNNIEVIFKKLNNEVYGYSKARCVVIDNSRPLNTQINTLLHEVAHVLMHKNSNLKKEEKELQAEAVAYVVMKHYNLEPKSCNYLALYDADEDKILQNLKLISETVYSILNIMHSTKL